MAQGSQSAAEARTGVVGQFGRGSIVLAVIVVQVTAFAIAFAVDLLLLYVLFALASAAVFGYVSERGWFGPAAAALGTVLLIALGLPLGVFVARQNFGLVVEKIFDPAVQQMLYLSIYAPLLSALVTVVFGVPLAYLLSRGFPGQELIESLVDLPLVIPHSVAGLLVLFGFGGFGGIRLPRFEILGFVVSDGGVYFELTVLNTMVGLVLAMVFVSAPFAVNVAREGFEAINTRVEYAARIHGADRFETFRRVSFPLAKRSVLTGGVLAWARSVSEFGAVAIVAYNVEFFYPGAIDSEAIAEFFGSGTIPTVTSQHAPVFIFNTYITGSLEESSAVGFLLLVFSIVIFLLVRWLAYDETTTTENALP
jgi:molybdate/tungstate transport system permease protein